MSDERQTERLLTVQDLTMRFGRKDRAVTAVRKVSFSIGAGETYGLVGESGSGKSTIGKCIIGLHTPSEGRISFDGHVLTKASEKERREAANGIQMIFQDPMSSLNPRKKVRDIVGAGLDIMKSCQTTAERNTRIEEILEKVGLAKDQADRYPAQFSGGQRQRVGIARALVMDPKLIIADECIAALDASIQAQVVNLLRRIQKETGTAFLFISHDLSMVRYLSDRIGVLHRGYLLETGLTREIFENPVHPYTKNLLNAAPAPNPIVQSRPAHFYDYETSGILYENGTWQYVGDSDTHQVFCTEEEYIRWGGKNNG
ncbi:MAG: ATP-binding cassette domain-containing protein [Lachnospiraceae bacterium]|nr:ATP-binding cassette domain-containing protein [Lachnospiraceae bacterium]